MIPARVMQRRPAALAVGVFAVVDPNQTSLVLSGLSVDPAYPGSPVTCLFTVSHKAPLFNLEIFPATDTFTGAVVDGTNGLVVGLLGSQKITLKYGNFTGVKLSTATPLPQSSAGDTLQVYVGPQSLMATATLGQPLYVSGSPGILSTTVQAQSGTAPSGQGGGGNAGGAPGGSSTSPNAPSAAIPVALVVGAGVVALGGAGWVAYRYLSKRRGDEDEEASPAPHRASPAPRRVAAGPRDSSPLPPRGKVGDVFIFDEAKNRWEKAS